MREFTKSMMSYTWALSIFGFQQAINLLAPSQGAEQTTKAKRALDDVTDATIGTFDQALRNMFSAGDRLQQQFIEVMFSGTGGFDPGRWIQMGSDMMKGAANMGRKSTSASANAAGAPTDSRSDASIFASSAPPQEPGWGPMPGS